MAPATISLRPRRRPVDEAGLTSETLSSASALLGLAGANIGDYGERLRAVLPFQQSIVETDALIALNGALGEHDGAVAIIGTGSAFVARSHGAIRSVGGWGFMVGDLGSGARVGRELLQETLLAHDGIHPGSALTGEVLRPLRGRPADAGRVATRPGPVDFGAFAPMVFDYAERGDPVAQRACRWRRPQHVEEALAALDAS